MAKSNYFSGKSVFGLLISLIEDKTIKEEGKRCNSDWYVKKFMARDHLIVDNYHFLIPYFQNAILKFI